MSRGFQEEEKNHYFFKVLIEQEKEIHSNLAIPQNNQF